MKKRAIHIKEMEQLLDKARIYSELVNVKAWKEDGTIVEYKEWQVRGGYWRGGFHRLWNPISDETRTVPDCFIFEINGLSVYY